MSLTPTLIEDLDRLIKEGKINPVRLELEKLNPKDLPRNQATIVARLTRRADLPTLGLRILNPYVRSSSKTAATATAEEKTEYAFCLTKFGAYHEALQLLDTLDEKSDPEILLSKSFALVAQWKFKESIPLLERYIADLSLTPYNKLVGEANLAAALEHERRHRETDELLSKLLESTKDPQYKFLHGRLLSLATQSAITQKKWPEAGLFIQRAMNLFDHVGGLEGFLVKKWQVLFNFARKPVSKEELERMDEVRKEAIAIKHWESVRQCDTYHAVATKDAALGAYIYFGTPFESFREKLVMDFGGDLNLPDVFEKVVGSAANKSKTLNFLVTEKDQLEELQTGKIFHRLVQTLISDFYRPSRIVGLHRQLYPDEFFNPYSSVDKIHQVLKRARNYFEENNIPLEIVEDDGMYSLASSVGCVVQLGKPNKKVENRKDSLLTRLKKEWPTDPFSTKQVKELLDISHQTALALLKEAHEKGQLEKIGAGPSTVYLFVKK